jgi:hypothetical protein
MREYLRHLDWKLVLFAFLACYVVPYVLFGVLLQVAFGSPEQDSFGRKVAPLLLLIYALLPALLGGYFTARYARALPQLHVLLVWMIGFGASRLLSANPFVVHLVYCVVTLLLAALGAFIYLRGHPRNVL